MNQKEAVYKAICSVTGEKEFSKAVELKGEEREQVRSMLFDQFRNGEIQFGGDFLKDDKRLQNYVSGLISNWLRKDNRLNGDQKYQPKNPGSRAGNGDEAMKAMRTLLAATTDQEARKEIQAEIDKRMGELRPKKTLNIEALPAHLRKFAKGFESNASSGGGDEDDEEYEEGSDDSGGGEDEGGKSKRGFAAMDPEKRSEIARKGGEASHGGGGRKSDDDNDARN